METQVKNLTMRSKEEETTEKESSIQVDTKVGTFHLMDDPLGEAFIYIVLDSNKQFLGNVYLSHDEDESEEEAKARFIKKLQAINHIAEIVNLGICEWMIYATSKEELLEEVNKYIAEESRKYGDDSDLISEDELVYGEYDFYNIVGNNHIIVDFD